MSSSAVLSTSSEPDDVATLRSNISPLGVRDNAHISCFLSLALDIGCGVTFSALYIFAEGLYQFISGGGTPIAVTHKRWKVLIIFS
jgi:hypothetical protein